MRIRSIRVVKGFGGWYIRRLCGHLLPEHRYIGPYKSPAQAAAMARRRGFNVQAVERN